MIKFADKHSFPVIFIDTAVPYVEIIKTTMKMILLDQTGKISEIRIDRLIDKNATIF